MSSPPPVAGGALRAGVPFATNVGSAVEEPPFCGGEEETAPVERCPNRDCAADGEGAARLVACHASRETPDTDCGGPVGAGGGDPPDPPEGADSDGRGEVDASVES
jgi:hypothetical protein